MEEVSSKKGIEYLSDIGDICLYYSQNKLIEEFLKNVTIGGYGARAGVDTFFGHLKSNIGKYCIEIFI